MELTRSSVRPHCALPPCPTGQRQPLQSASTQCHSVCRRTRLQVAWVAATVWEMAHRLHPDESVVEGRGPRPSLRAVANAHQFMRLKLEAISLDSTERQGPSRRHRRGKKNGPQAIGKSRGGWTTKLHLAAADARTAVTFALSPGQAHDAPEGAQAAHPASGPSRSPAPW